MFVELNETFPNKANGIITTYVCRELGARRGKDLFLFFLFIGTQSFHLGGEGLYLHFLWKSEIATLFVETLIV